MTGPVYKVPLSRLADFAGCDLVVRCADPSALVRVLGDDVEQGQLEHIAYVRIESSADAVQVLASWAEGMAIEVASRSPGEDLPAFYACAALADSHPVRVSLPVVPGFETAARVALALDLAVRLELGTPDAPLCEALGRLLQAYLHGSTVAQPVEPFHSLLMAYYHDEPANLWAIQEEDPALVRYVDDQGIERLPGKLAGAECLPDLGTDPAGDPGPEGSDPDRFVERFAAELSAAGGECIDCPFFDRCRGYFKWPDREYSCAGIRPLLGTLEAAGLALRADLAAAGLR